MTVPLPSETSDRDDMEGTIWIGDMIDPMDGPVQAVNLPVSVTAELADDDEVAIHATFPRDHNAVVTINLSRTVALALASLVRAVVEEPPGMVSGESPGQALSRAHETPGGSPTTASDSGHDEIVAWVNARYPLSVEEAVALAEMLVDFREAGNAA